MDLIIGIERVTALVFIITGLSHVTAPREWARFFVAVRDRSAVPGFVNAWIHGPLGVLILAFHWVWSWPGVVVTLIGCGLTLKAWLHFTFPALALRTMAPVSEERALPFRLGGALMLVTGLWIGWISLGSPRL